MQRRKALVDKYRASYASATKLEKGRLLDEFVARSGYHRKHAVRLLSRGVAGPRPRYFDDAARNALATIWEAAGGPGSRRLKAHMPDLVTAAVRDGRLPLDPVVQAKLLTASAATIDRLLAPVRAKSALTRLEDRLTVVTESVAALATFSVPDDLPANERRHIEALHAAVFADLRKLSGGIPAVCAPVEPSPRASSRRSPK